MNAALDELAAPRVIYVDRPGEPARSDVAKPDKFNGKNPEKLNTFLIDCETFFLTNPPRFRPHRARIIFCATYLSDEAKNWWGGYVEDFFEETEKYPFLLNWHLFKAELRVNFGIPNEVERAEVSLRKLKMTEKDHVSKYRRCFDELAKLTGWNNEALAAQFYSGLPQRIKDAFAVRTTSRLKDLSLLASIALAIDENHWLNRAEQGIERANSDEPRKAPKTHANSTPNQAKKSNFAASSSRKQSTSTPARSSGQSSTTPNDIAKNLGPNGKLTDAERQRRMDNNLCAYCGKPGHKAADCRKAAHNHKDSKARATKSDPVASASKAKTPAPAKAEAKN